MDQEKTEKLTRLNKLSVRLTDNPDFIRPGELALLWDAIDQRPGRLALRWNSTWLAEHIHSTLVGLNDKNNRTDIYFRLHVAQSALRALVEIAKYAPHDVDLDRLDTAVRMEIKSSHALRRKDPSLWKIAQNFKWHPENASPQDVDHLMHAALRMPSNLAMRWNSNILYFRLRSVIIIEVRTAASKIKWKFELAERSLTALERISDYNVKSVDQIKLYAAARRKTQIEGLRLTRFTRWIHRKFPFTAQPFGLPERHFREYGYGGVDPARPNRIVVTLEPSRFGSRKVIYG